MRQIISSLDLGSNTIKLVVGEVFEDKVYVLSKSEVKCSGIKQGVVVNEEEVKESLKELLKNIENSLGIKINKTILVVPSYDALFIKAEGYHIIENEDKIVEGKDITKALQASVYSKVSSNMELVSVTPIDFIINEEETLLDPKGKTTNRLVVRSLLSAVPRKNILGALSVLDKMGIKVVDLCFSEQADYFAFKNDKYIDKTLAVINIGEYKTEIGIIDNNLLVANECLDLGGRNIDRDISYLYDITLEESKKLKETFANANKPKASTSETIEVLNKDKKLIKINQYEISDAVYSRIREILESAKKTINLLTKKEISYIIITGGTTEVEGFSKVFNEVFTKDYEATSLNVMGVRNNKYSSVVGAIRMYADKLNFRERIASTITEEDEKAIMNNKKKINENSILGKIYGYFFDN